jgi:hypothetical protein
MCKFQVFKMTVLLRTVIALIKTVTSKTTHQLINNNTQLLVLYSSDYLFIDRYLVMSENGALTLSWTYGFSKDVLGSVQSLTSRDRNALVFLSSHSAIIYNYEFKTQVILQVIVFMNFACKSNLQAFRDIKIQFLAVL